jgi:hypothetical protein
MKKNIERTFQGGFASRELAPGAWHLTAGSSPGAEIYLTGVEPGAASALGEPGLEALTIEWRSDTVLLTLAGAALRQSHTLGNAIVHEPLAELYETLPLVSFDHAARRFWRRVFRLVRIPGGRHLLGLIARRGRDQKKATELDHMRD